ncbi:hypothetical protein TB1_037255 [Malus domestica]
MVNAVKGLFISRDIPMAQFIINYDNSLPASQRFIIHVLDSTHNFVQPHAAEMIRSAIAEFIREAYLSALETKCLIHRSYHGLNPSSSSLSTAAVNTHPSFL